MLIAVVADSPRVAGPPPAQPTGCVVVGWGYSVRAMAQQKPLSSRATAMAMMVRRLLRRSSRCQVRCRRCWAL